jgi:hypothetical protein
MSTDIFSPVQLGSKELVSARGVALWLFEARSGERGLNSIFPMNLPRDHQSIVLKANIDSTASGSDKFGTAILSGTIGAGWGFILAIVGNGILRGKEAAVPTPFLLLTMAVAGIIAALIWHMSAVYSKDKSQATWNQLMSIQAEGVDYWLAARYGLAVNQKTSKILVERVLLWSSTINFTDLNGNSWVLHLDADTNSYTVRTMPISAEAPLMNKKAVAV